MTTPIKSYLGRSIDLLRRSTAKVVQSEPTPKALPTTIFSYDSSKPPIDKVDQFGLGSDIEVGGLSTCNLSLIPSSPSSSSSTVPRSSTSITTSTSAEGDNEDGRSYSHLSFYGFLSTKIPPSKVGQIRTGYAGFRNISKPTLFGQDNWDLELYSHLKVKVGYRGWEGWRNRWVVNIGIDGRPKSDVFQHRLELPPSSSSTSSRIPLDPLSFDPTRTSFSTLYLPLSSFVLIKKGQVANSPIPLDKSSVRTIGFALLGRDRGDDGPKVSQQQKQQNTSSLLKSFNLGGWGKTTENDLENDQELKQLLEEDQNLSSGQRPTPVSQGQGQRKTSASPPSSNLGGYHRVGATEASPATTISGEPTTNTNTNPATQDEREGYFELCIKSVEAVKWDPEMDSMDADLAEA